MAADDTTDRMLTVWNEARPDLGIEALQVTARLSRIGPHLARRQRGGHERVGISRPEEIIVFDAGSPIRGEAVLKTDTDNASPTGPLRLHSADARRGVEDVETLVCDGSTALHIKQGCIPSVTNLTREEAQSIDIGLPGVGWVERTNSNAGLRGGHGNLAGS